jgi:hypothetical protein
LRSGEPRSLIARLTPKTPIRRADDRRTAYRGANTPNLTWTA